ncbi:MAG: hypothetical protein MJ211_10055 [Bacteroidales bacterium]|nr:hypothetical protein [Bacteroidales bacterium]
MPVNISNEELDIFNNNGFTDDDVKATIENYRSQGLDDVAIRQKVDDRLKSWQQNGTQYIQQPNQESKTPYADLWNGSVDDITNAYDKGELSLSEAKNLLNTKTKMENTKANIQGLGEGTRTGIGALLQGASFHPVLNIPYVGTGLGGALFEAGQGIMEGKPAKDILKDTGKGFVFGETLGAIPYAGKAVGKTKVGKAVLSKTGDILEKVGRTKAGQVADKVGKILNKEINFPSKQQKLNLPAVVPQVEQKVSAKIVNEIETPDVINLGTSKREFTPEYKEELTKQFMDEFESGKSNEIEKFIIENLSKDEAQSIFDEGVNRLNKKWELDDAKKEYNDIKKSLDDSGFELSKDIKKQIDLEKKQSMAVARNIIKEATGKNYNAKTINSKKAQETIDFANTNDTISIGDYAASPEVEKLFGKFDPTDINNNEKYIARARDIISNGGESTTEFIARNKADMGRAYAEKKLYELEQKYPEIKSEKPIAENISQPKEQVIAKQPVEQVANKVEEVLPQPKQVEPPVNKVEEQVFASPEKERGFVKSIRKNYGEDIANQIQDNTYTATSHAEDMAKWNSLNKEQQISKINDVDDMSREAIYGKADVVKNAINNGEELPSSILDGLASKGTELGQTLEAYKHFTPDTPEGIALKVAQANRKIAPKQANILKDDAKTIIKEVQDLNTKTEAALNDVLNKAPEDIKKQYNKKGDEAALLKAMEKYRVKKVKQTQRILDKAEEAKMVGVARKIKELDKEELKAQLSIQKDELKRIKDVSKLLEKNKKEVLNIITKKIPGARKEKAIKSLANDITRLNELDGLNPDNFVELINKHYDLPTISKDDYSKIQKLCDDFVNETDAKKKREAEAYIRKFIWDKIPKTRQAKEKVRNIINMLSAPAGRIADIVSTNGINAIYRPAEKVVAKGIDVVSNKLLGQPQVRGSLSDILDAKTFLNGAFREGSIAAKDALKGIDTASGSGLDRYELGNLPMFEGTLYEIPEKISRATINIPDRAFKGGTFDVTSKELKNLGLSDEEINDIANFEALKSVWQQNGGLAEGTTKAARWIDEKTGRFRLGSRNIPFPKTPTNLQLEAMGRTPAGFISAMYKYRNAKTVKEIRDAQDALAKALVGTGTGLAGANILSNMKNNLGNLSSVDVRGDDIQNLPAQSVVMPEEMPYLGGKALGLQHFYNYTAPAIFWKPFFEDDRNIKESLTDPMNWVRGSASVSKTALDAPGVKGLSDIGKSLIDVNNALQKEDDAQLLDSAIKQASGVAGNTMANYISQEIPLSGFLGSIRNATDPYNREVYSENPLEYARNRVMNRIPGLSKKLPMKYNDLGQPSLRYNLPEGQGWINAISPVTISNYTEKPEYMDYFDEIEKVGKEYGFKGSKSIQPAKAKRYIEIGEGKDKEKIKLNNEQYSVYSRVLNSTINKYMEELYNSQEFMNMDVESQIKEINKYKKEIKNEANKYMVEYINNQ